MKTLRNLTGALLIAFISTTGALMAQTPVTPEQSQAPQSTEYSDEELKNFISAYQKIQMMSQNMQREVAEMVQEEGMDVQRFNEIHQAKMTPGQETDATPEEKELHTEILSEVETMQRDFDKEIEGLMEHEAISLEKYQEIATALQTDQQLQTRLQQLMQG